MYDGGQRLIFETPEAWMERLKRTHKLNLDKGEII